MRIYYDSIIYQLTFIIKNLKFKLIFKNWYLKQTLKITLNNFKTRGFK